MENKGHELDEFSFMNQKSKVISMKSLGDKQSQIKKPMKYTNQIINYDNLAKHMSGYGKERARLQMIIQNLQEENSRLSCQVALIEGAKSQKDRDKIFKEFEADFNNKAERLEDRKKKLIELEKLVHSFRCIEQEEEMSKTQSLSTKKNTEEPVLFIHKQKARKASPKKEKSKNKDIFFDDSDDESDSGSSKTKTSSLKLSESSLSPYKKKKKVKMPKFKKYLVKPPPQSLIVTNINPFPFNKSSYPPSANVSAASMYAFQQQQQQNATTITTTSTIKSGQQHKTVQFTPQHQKQLPTSKVLQNVQKMVDTDTLYHQNLNARRNLPSPTPMSLVTAVGPLHNSNESNKTKTQPDTRLPPNIIDRSELVAEHERLVAISLNLERVMLVKKMQLRLCHDHRDLCQLRIMLNSIEGGESANTSEKQIARRYKSKIKNLKAQIQREKARLITVTKKPVKEEAAAISIQSLMRGFLCRNRLKAATITNNDTTIF